MNIIEYFTSTNPLYWLGQIKKCSWDAGQYLHQLIISDTIKKLCGEKTKVLLLVDNDVLISFCTYAEQDDVYNVDLTPWIGFVYTFPEYRKNHYSGRLLEYSYNLAKIDGFTKIYISTNEIGLYEKYGYTLYAMMKDKNNADTRVYSIEVN
jgi:GNAT superfamily N-acetyltransferase